MRYADVLAIWLKELGYTHCFFVAGGGIMHLLDAVRTRMTCVPVVHEVAAGIATEYFNEVSSSGLAFALVTAGPGVTNILTAMAGAYLESRQLLVLAGQVKSADLATGGIRQRGQPTFLARQGILQRTRGPAGRCVPPKLARRTLSSR